MKEPRAERFPRGAYYLPGWDRRLGCIDCRGKLAYVRFRAYLARACMSIKKRLAALERSLRARCYEMSVLEDVSLNKLPDAQKELLEEAMQKGFTTVSQAEADDLNAAISALPAPDRYRVLDNMQRPMILVLCERGGKLAETWLMLQPLGSAWTDAGAQERWTSPPPIK